MRDAQGLGGRLLDAKPVPEAGGAKQLVLPAFFRPNRVLAILAFMAIIVAPWLIDQWISNLLIIFAKKKLLIQFQIFESIELNQLVPSIILTRWIQLITISSIIYASR